jgi:SAM-dependent methyltransferase
LTIPEATTLSYEHLWTEAWGDLQRYGPASRHQRRVTARMLDAAPFGSVLDVGCGDGTNLAFLAHRYRPAVMAGLDVSSAAVARATERVPRAAFHVGDASAAAQLGRFDLVTCIDVLEHVDDDERLLNALSAASARYVFCVTVQGRMRRGEREIGHVRNYRIGELQEKVAGAGLRVREAVEWGFPFYSPVFRSLVAGSASESLSYGRYGVARRLLCEALYRVFLLNSWRRGDRIFLLAEKT